MPIARAIAAPAAATDLLGWGSVISAASASALWLWVLITQGSMLAAGGALCGEASGVLGHCAACLPAALLTGLAVILAVGQWRPGRRV